MEQRGSKRQRNDPGSSTDLPFKRIRHNLSLGSRRNYLASNVETEKESSIRLCGSLPDEYSSSGDGSSTDDFTSSAGSPSSSSSSALSSSDSESERDDDSISQEGLEGEVQSSHHRLNGSSLISVPAPLRPQICHINGSTLLSEVSSFLPKLKAANQEIQKDIAAGKAVILDAAGVEKDDGQYIEMNLGLGVLEEKRNGDNTESENESNSEESSHSSSDAKIRSLHEKRKVTDVLRRLMGNKSKPKKPGIEEVDDSSKKE